MARTKAEVRAFLDSKVGTIVANKPDAQYNGQCVTLIKALLEFLGAPNPYAARGDARDVGDALIRQGIGTSGRGWLTVAINKDMGLIGGVRYGHIWLDLLNEANYESNGARALYTTKNTRPFTQAQQIINLDQWITGDNDTMNQDDAIELYRAILHREPENDQVWRPWVGRRFAEAARSFRGSEEWLSQNHMVVFFNEREQQLNEARAQLANANNQLKIALDNDATDKAAITAAQQKAQEALDNLTNVTKNFNDVKSQLDAAKANEELAVKTGNAFTRWIGEQLNKILGGK